MSAASMLICAVSRSRISPTMMMSGSARIIARSPVAKVRPERALTGDLGDAVQLVLDGVLDRDDVLVGRVERVERRRRAWSTCRSRSGPVTRTEPWAWPVADAQAPAARTRRARAWGSR